MHFLLGVGSAVTPTIRRSERFGFTAIDTERPSGDRLVFRPEQEGDRIGDLVQLTITGSSDFCCKTIDRRVERATVPVGVVPVPPMASAALLRSPCARACEDGDMAHQTRASATANVSMYWRKRVTVPSFTVQTWA